MNPRLRAEQNLRALRPARTALSTAGAVAAVASIVAFCPSAFAQVGGTMAQDAGAGAGTRALQTAGQVEGTNGLQLNTGLTHSDNIRRTANDEVSDTIASVGFTADTVRDGTRLDYRLLADMTWAEYLDNTYKGQPFGALDGNLKFAILPGRFFWDARDTFSQLTLDPAAAATPDNTESFNYFTTGPRGEFAFGSNMQLSVYGTYSAVHYMSRNADTTGVDSKRYSGGLTLRHVVSEGTSSYLAVTSQKVKFDDVTIVGDYDRQEAYVGYHLEGGRTFADVSVGATRLERTSGPSQSGFLGRLELARKISPSSTVSLQATEQIGDSVDMFRSGFDRPTGLAGLQEFATTDPFRERLVGVSWNFQRPRTSFSLSATVTQDRYETQTTLDRKSRGIGASFTRRLNPLFDFNLSAQYQRDDFDNINVENKLKDIATALAWHVGRRLDVTFHYTRAERDSAGQGVEYNENRYGATLAYNLTPPRR